MGKVQLKILPWVASMLNADDSSWLLLDQEIKKGETIGSLFKELAITYNNFRRIVFNPDTGKINDEVMVALNNNLVQSTDLMKIRLHDGDFITLFSSYFGG